MNTTLAYLLALGEDRSCLANATGNDEESTYVDGLLSQLIWLTGDVVSACVPTATCRVEL